MAATLRETLLAPEVQSQVVADCEALVNGEVATMSGISGTAVKLAYKAVRTYDAGHIHYMIETLLPAVRGSAAKHVKAALPAVGALVERYAF